MVDLPIGKKKIGCKWVFITKYNVDGTLNRYKARLIAKWFTQIYGIHYLETFAPVSASLNCHELRMATTTTGRKKCVSKW